MTDRSAAEHEMSRIHSGGGSSRPTSRRSLCRETTAAFQAASGKTIKNASCEVGSAWPRLNVSQAMLDYWRVSVGK